jgi:ankyrin repeat protein
MDEHDEEDHDNIMAMEEEEEIHHDHHDHDGDDDEEEEEMDMEPTRVVMGGMSNNNNIVQIIDFWEHEPTKDEIFEVRFRQ